MFCEKCGHKVNEQEKFCEKCGFSLKADKINNTGIQTKNPEDKAWFRFFKVAYIVGYVLSILLVVGISISTIPKEKIDDALSTIKCNNGKTYSLSRNNLYTSNSILDYSEDKNARILCQYDTVNYYNYLYSNQQINKNYTFNPFYTTPNYKSWAIYSLVALLIMWLLLILIRIGFLYIAIGGKPNWKKEFLQTWF
jgi:ribosomal protein L37E